MRAIIRYVTRKSRGGVALREAVADAELIVAGRGNDCQIHLPDPRVLLRHAEFSLRNNDVYATVQGAADLRINGSLVQSGKVQVGDKVRVGPYEITCETAAAQSDVVMSVELVQPLEDDLERLSQSDTHLNRIGLSIRAWSWLLAFIVLAGTFAVPLLMHTFSPKIEQARSLQPTNNRKVRVATAIWSSGEISGAHKFFGDNCETCHEKPFVPVRDEACLACHRGVPHHADPERFPFANFADRTCESCHKEHRGNTTVALSDQAFCASCHGGQVTMAMQSDLRKVTDFGKDHPQFKPTVITDVALHVSDRSHAIGETPAPREDSGLKFPHAKHLRVEGVRDPSRGNIKLECADCHQSEDGGVSMKPVSFERNCHRCHQLNFDTFVPGRELPHGKPELLAKQVRDIYDAVALRGGYDEPEAPALIRRRVGEQLTTEEKKIVIDWAADKTQAVLNGRFGKGLCAECHELLATPTTAPQEAGTQVSEIDWTVVPATLAGLYFPKAYFNHEPHRDVACIGCHAAKESLSANDVLMPSITVCKSCHGGEDAKDRVPSPCITCHAFHRKSLSPMHPVKTSTEGTATQRSSSTRELQ